MSLTRWLTGLLLMTFALFAVLPAQAIDAKTGILTFEKVVILAGGDITEPVKITDKADLADTALDSMRPSGPPQDDLGAAYQLILHPEGSDTTMEVIYYASRSGERGYIYQEKPVSLGGGTLHPGWSRPSPALESTLRNHGAVDLPAHSEGFFSAWTISLIVAALTLAILTIAWTFRARIGLLARSGPKDIVHPTAQ